VSCRLTYWLERIAHGGEVVTFGNAGSPIQWIDARDLCQWSLSMAEQGKGGVFNLTGPKTRCSSGMFYQYLQDIAGVEVAMVHLPLDFKASLTKQHLPPGALGVGYQGFESFNQINCDKAIEAGLTFRTAIDTFRDTFNWSEQWDHDYHFKVTGMDSLHRPIKELLEIEQQVKQHYQAWLESTKNVVD